jgi:hypothetical protein
MRAERIGARVREHSLCMADEGPVAATHDDSREDLKGTTYELFILAISILSIVNLVLVSIFEFKSSYWWLVAMVDMALTLIFVFDFGYRLQTAPSNRQPWATYRLAREAHDLDLREEMGRVSAAAIPTLVVGCATDTLTTPAICAGVARRLGGECRQVEGDGHMWMLSNWPEFQGILDR